MRQEPSPYRSQRRRPGHHLADDLLGLVRVVGHGGEVGSIPGSGFFPKT